MWTFLDQRDEMQKVKRRNHMDHFTPTIESLVVANSIASDVGFAMPFGGASLPGIEANSEELRFDMKFQNPESYDLKVMIQTIIWRKMS